MDISADMLQALLELGHEVLAADFAFDGIDERAERET